MDWQFVYTVLKDAGAWGGLAYLAKSGISLFLQRLTRREKELLVATDSTRQKLVVYHYYSGLGRGPWISTGPIHFGNDDLTCAEFVEALERLVSRGHFQLRGDGGYTLTAKGMRAAAV